MAHEDWIAMGEYANYASAQVVAQRLKIEGIPHRIIASSGPRDPTCWIWIPPRWADKVKQILAANAVSDDELAKLALSYPPPDDAESLK
jgi:hypothetical protein